MAQTILLFQADREKEKAITQICRTRKIALYKVAPKDYEQKMGFLAKIKGFEKEAAVYRGAALPAEMLVFSGMNSEQVDGFLQEYKNSGNAPIGLKAVLTQYNVFWTPLRLFEELRKEHQSVRK